MKLKLVNHLLEVEMDISYKGKKKTIDRLVVDTGAAHTLNQHPLCCHIHPGHVEMLEKLY